MTAQTCFTDEITVDGFCGGGGWSTGFELAIGRPVDIGINHDAAAIALHKFSICGSMGIAISRFRAARTARF